MGPGVEVRAPLPGPAAGGAPQALRAPLFAALISRMRTAGRAVVLDLGPAQGATIALLNEFPCRLDIADLAASLDAIGAVDDLQQMETLIESLLPRRRPEATDAVLCWGTWHAVCRNTISSAPCCCAMACRSSCFA